MIRDLEAEDFKDVAAALYWAWSRGKRNKSWIGENWNEQKNHEDYFAQLIFDMNSIKVVVDDAYLIVCTPGPSWFDPCRIELEVNLILKIRKGSNFKALCDALDTIAVKNGCDYIRAGTALSGLDDALVKRWLSNGYEKFETIVCKQIGDRTWAEENK